MITCSNDAFDMLHDMLHDKIEEQGFLMVVCTYIMSKLHDGKWPSPITQYQANSG